MFIHRFPAAISVRMTNRERGDLGGTQIENSEDIMVFKYGQSDGAPTKRRTGVSFFEPNTDHYEPCHEYMMTVSGADRDTCRTGTFEAGSVTEFVMSCDECKDVHRAGFESDHPLPNSGTPILGRHWIFYPLQKMRLSCFDRVVAAFLATDCQVVVGRNTRTRILVDVGNVPSMEDKAAIVPSSSGLQGSTSAAGAVSARFWQDVVGRQCLAYPHEIRACGEVFMDLYDSPDDAESLSVINALIFYAAHVRDPNAVVASLQLIERICAGNLDLSDILQLNTFSAILENALEDYPADGTEIIELDMVRLKVHRTWGTAITLQSGKIVDQVLPQPVAYASLWSLTGIIDEFTTHRQYDDFLKETHEMSILQAITKHNIGDVATREYVEKHMSTRVICGSVQVILPPIAPALQQAQIVECNGRRIRFESCEEITEMRLPLAKAASRSVTIRVAVVQHSVGQADTVLAVELLVEENQWSEYTTSWNRCNWTDTSSGRCETFVKYDMYCKSHSARFRPPPA